MRNFAKVGNLKSRVKISIDVLIIRQEHNLKNVCASNAHAP